MISRTYSLRGIVGKELTEKVINKFAGNAINYIYEKDLNKAIIVGCDNRLSSDYINNLLQSKIVKSGIKVLSAGECSMPELVYLTRNFRAGLGIMITASHNSSEYNGFKCFDCYGEGLDITDVGYKRVRRKVDFERVIDISRYKELYFRDLKNSLTKNDIKCVFDCSNGSTRDVVRKLFKKSKIINTSSYNKLSAWKYDDDNLDGLIGLCKKNKCIGFNFSSDGSRVKVISSRGEVLDGDKIVYILASQFLYKGETVVGTSDSSIALELSLRRLGIKFVRETVGIDNICNRIKRCKYVLGGESCGHIVIDKIGVSDGVYTAILILNILNRTGLGLEDLLIHYKKMYTSSKNILLKDVVNLEFDSLNMSTSRLRIIVRKSKTEPMVRIVIEGEEEKEVNEHTKRVLMRLGDKYEK